MSVFIKTITNLPEHCYDCPCHNGESGYCQADKGHRYSDYRPFWCPLLEIPLAKAIPFAAVEEMKRKIKEHNEFSRNEIDEMYMQDVLKIIDECCGIIEAYKAESDTEKRKPCINYEDGCEEWAGCTCVYYKAESEEKE